MYVETKNKWLWTTGTRQIASQINWLVFVGAASAQCFDFSTPNVMIGNEIHQSNLLNHFRVDGMSSDVPSTKQLRSIQTNV